VDDINRIPTLTPRLRPGRKLGAEGVIPLEPSPSDDGVGRLTSATAELADRAFDRGAAVRTLSDLEQRR
jgi:hypothetical protein